MIDPVLAKGGVMPELTGDEMLDAEIIGFARGFMFRIAEEVAEMLRRPPKVPWSDEMPQWWKDRIAKIVAEHAEEWGLVKVDRV